MFDYVTPLKKDCGILCGGACCKDGPEEQKGMLLFPYEEKMLGNSGFEIKESNWKYDGKNAYILFCKGTCDRKYRPLACRIFPLVPVISDKDNIELIMNPLAKRMCPLARSIKPRQLEPDFIKNTYRALNRISKLKGGKEYIRMLSDITKDFQKFKGEL